MASISTRARSVQPIEAGKLEPLTTFFHSSGQAGPEPKTVLGLDPKMPLHYIALHLIVTCVAYGGFLAIPD